MGVWPVVSVYNSGPQNSWSPGQAGPDYTLVKMTTMAPATVKK
jgi:hypothetical protein